MATFPILCVLLMCFLAVNCSSKRLFSDYDFIDEEGFLIERDFLEDERELSDDEMIEMIEFLEDDISNNWSQRQLDNAPIEGITVHSEDTPYSAKFPAQNVLTKVLSTHYVAHYWLLPSHVVDQGFVLDLGEMYDVTSIILWNTPNNKYRDRGTENFEINLSINAVDWKTIGDGTLTDVRNKVQTSDIFAFSGKGRYLQFIAKSYYGLGAGLQFIEVFGESAECATTGYSECFEGKGITALNNRVTLNIATREECVNLCLCITEFDCISIDYEPSTATCKTSVESRLSVPGEYKDYPTHHYCDVTKNEGAEMVCEADWKLYEGHCYKLFGSPVKPSAAANAKCQSEGAQLVSIETEGENVFVENMLDMAQQDGTLKGHTDIWLGASRPDRDSAYIWNSGAELVYTDWKEVPSRKNNNCAQSFKNGNKVWQWGMAPCLRGADNDNAVLCEKSAGCPSGYSFISSVSSGSCYKLHTDAVSFDEAVDGCEAEGANMVSAATIDEYTALVTWLDAESVRRDIWLSLSYSGAAGGPWGNPADYTWPDGTQVPSELWVPGEPSTATTKQGDPVNVVIWWRKNQQLDNRAPATRAAYVCEKTIG